MPGNASLGGIGAEAQGLAQDETETEHGPRGGRLRFGLLGMESNPNPEDLDTCYRAQEYSRQGYPNSQVSLASGDQ